MGHCGGSNDDTPDEEAAKLAAEVVLYVGTSDPELARKVRDLGAHVMRMIASRTGTTDAPERITLHEGHDGYWYRFGQLPGQGTGRAAVYVRS